MEFSNLISASLGAWHLAFSLLALLTGTVILLRQKGDKLHKQIGYVYCFAMLGLNTSAFGIYSLFGKFGIFHWMAILSSLTLLAGMLPIILKRPKSYLTLHISFMYWSVMGLYAAFVSESLVRIPDVVIENGLPNGVFYTLSGIGSGVCMAIAAYYFIMKKSSWFKINPDN
jgi:uncharacterized membrane protein